jgi:hypothetical protein
MNFSGTTTSFADNKLVPGNASKRIQAKLQVNEPGDVYEREADAMAERVMQSQPSPAGSSAQPITGLLGQSVQRKCAHCEEEEKHRKVMRKASTGTGGTSVSSSFASTLHGSKGGGASLPSGTRSFMEQAFSTDFSRVRIHTNGQAAAMNKHIHANAFTHGNDIYFNEGRYGTESTEGRKLLAHELTHTLQQGGGSGTIQRDYATELANPDALFEGFNGEQIDDAIAFNERQHYSTEDIGLYRDVLGLNPAPAIFDEDLINAIGEYQAQNNLTVDGKMRLGGETARRLARELRGEGSFLGGSAGRELMAANRRLCPSGAKTITVDFVRLSGSTISPATELSAANRIFRPCCIQFTMGKNVRISLANTQSWLGGDTDVNASGITCAATTAEERSMYDAATLAHTLTSRMRVFLVDTFSGYGAAGFSRPPYCSGGGYSNHVILANVAAGATNPLAHEFGHILQNNDVHSTGSNLMAPSGGTFLDATQCATCFANA